MGSKRMAESVARCRLDDTGPRHGGVYIALYDGGFDVMPAFLPGLRIAPSRVLRKDPLPAPLLAGVGILLGECIGKLDLAPSES